MSETAQKPVVQVSPEFVKFVSWFRSNPLPLHCFFSGRIRFVKSFRGPEGTRFFQHEIAMAAPEGYDSDGNPFMPSTLLVDSASRLGSAGDTISGVLATSHWLDKPIQSKRPDPDGVFQFWRPRRASYRVVEIFA